MVSNTDGSLTGMISWWPVGRMVEYVAFLYATTLILMELMELADVYPAYRHCHS